MVVGHRLPENVWNITILLYPSNDDIKLFTFDFFRLSVDHSLLLKGLVNPSTLFNDSIPVWQYPTITFYW
jgi:hypothetical protein